MGSWDNQEPEGRKFDLAIPTVSIVHSSQDYGHQNPSSLNETLLFEDNSQKLKINRFLNAFIPEVRLLQGVQDSQFPPSFRRFPIENTLKLGQAEMSLLHKRLDGFML